MKLKRVKRNQTTWKKKHAKIVEERSKRIQKGIPFNPRWYLSDFYDILRRISYKGGLF